MKVLSAVENVRLAAAQVKLANDETTRREFLTLATALGAAPAVAYSMLGAALPSQVHAKPIRGGQARLQCVVRAMKDPVKFDYNPLANFARGWLEYLVTYNNDGTLTPALLSNWSSNDEASEYTLNVRPGVFWNNGDPFTASDVAFNLRRMCDSQIEGNSMAPRFTVLSDPATGRARPEAIKVVDELTVKLSLSAPDVAIMANLADYPAAIVHQTFDPDRIIENPIGTGPYLPVSYEVGNKAVLERNKNHVWWNNDNGAWLDRIEFVDFGEDRTAWIAAAEADELDHLFVLDGDFVDLVSGLDDWTVAEVSTAATIVIRPNQAAEVNGMRPYEDVRVRRALALAVDNAIVLELGVSGQGDAAENHHIAPVQLEYSPGPNLKRDPTEAQRLMRAAGMSDFVHELVSLDAGWMKDTADACAAQLRDAGIKVRRRVLPSSSFWNEWTKYPFSTTAWNHRPLAVQVFSVAYMSNSIWNETGVSNAELDAVVTKALSVADPIKRRGVMSLAQRIMQEEGITIQPYWRSLHNAQKSRLKGGEIHISQVVDPKLMYWEANS